MTHVTPDPFFFGYGSLVNRKTHAYAEAYPACIRGWRRQWRHTALREQAFLTAVPAEGGELDGLVAGVPGGDWAALDLREEGYDRLTTPHVTHGVDRALDVHIYSISPDKHIRTDGVTPILLSYLDVVVQGYLTEFGEDGVQRFFDTTDGWDSPVLDDRADPLYPRHQVLSPSERGLVDDHLARLSALVEKR